MEKLGTVLKVMLCLWLIKWIFENCTSAIVGLCLFGLLVCAIGYPVELIQKHYASVESAKWAATSAQAASTACTKSGGEPKWCVCVFSYLYEAGGDVTRRLTRDEQDHPERDVNNHGSFAPSLVQSGSRRCIEQLAKS